RTAPQDRGEECLRGGHGAQPVGRATREGWRESHCTRSAGETPLHCTHVTLESTRNGGRFVTWSVRAFAPDTSLVLIMCRRLCDNTMCSTCVQCLRSCCSCLP